jgi:hypothetical protein
MIKSEQKVNDMSLLPKIPVRVVMNNKTVTVYTDDTLKTNLASFVLRSTLLSRVNDEPRCFILSGNNDKIQLCAIDSTTADFVEQWDYDFNLFKYQCHEKRSTYNLNKSEAAKLKDEFNNKMNQIKADLVDQKAQAVKKQNRENEEIKLSKKIQSTQSMTLMALQRETRLEELLEKEELDKQKQEQEELNLQYENEKKKNECLLKSIKEKQLEDQMNISKSNAEAAIERLKEEAKKQIMVKRLQMKKKLETIRARNLRKKQQIQNNIMTLIMEVANQMQKVSKLGDAEKCFVPSCVSEYVEQYCQIN